MPTQDDAILDVLYEQKPSFLKSADVIPGLMHASMIFWGFRLSSGIPNAMPSEWNSKEEYSFEYKHSQSSLTFVIKFVKMGNVFLVHGMSVEDNKIASVNLKIPDTQSIPSTKEEMRRVYETINGAELIQTFKEEIIKKLAPGITKQGYEEYSAHAATQTTSDVHRGHPSTEPRHDPLRVYEPRRPLYGIPAGAGAFGNPDLDPLAAAPGILPGAFGTSGLTPHGMFVGPDDPMFSGEYGSGYQDPTRLPPGAVPFGARFDPITPLGPRPMIPGHWRPARNGYGSGMPFSGEPNPDMEPPGPSFGSDMFL